jgi:hypothetical protein
MFKDMSSGFSKFFTNQRVVILVVFIVLAWGLSSYSGEKIGVIDRFENGVPVGAVQGYAPPVMTNQPSMQPSTQPVPSVTNVQSPSQPSTGQYALQKTTNPSDLLPSDQNSQWATLNPSGGNGPVMPDILQAGYHIGLDTIGQTLRNPNYQLRSDPIIPKSDIGPWNQSTIEPDLGRIPLEVGCK